MSRTSTLELLYHRARNRDDKNLNCASNSTDSHCGNNSYFIICVNFITWDNSGFITVFEYGLLFLVYLYIEQFRIMPWMCITSNLRYGASEFCFIILKVIDVFFPKQLVNSNWKPYVVCREEQVKLWFCCLCLR